MPRCIPWEFALISVDSLNMGGYGLRNFSSNLCTVCSLPPLKRTMIPWFSVDCRIWPYSNHIAHALEPAWITSFLVCPSNKSFSWFQNFYALYCELKKMQAEGLCPEKSVSIIYNKLVKFSSHSG